MRICCYPGTFDPFTLGHLDILKRAASVFDRVIVGILVNIGKRPLFTEDERKHMIEAAAREACVENVSVECFGGLLVDFCREREARAIIRGLRTASEYEHESQTAAANKLLDPGVETLFMPTDPRYAYLSSSALKEVGRFGGDISSMLPAVNLNYVKERLLQI